MGLVRLILPAVLLIACVFAWGWSYQHNHTVLLCGLDGQINVARSQEGYLAIVVSRRRVAPSDIGVWRVMKDTPTTVGSRWGNHLKTWTTESSRTWGPSNANVVDYVMAYFSRDGVSTERYSWARIATAVERRPSEHEWLSAGIILTWAYPTFLALVWLLLRARPALRYHRRKRDGLCRHCGYDLRGSPGGCPECGDGRAGVSNKKEIRPMRPIRNVVVVLVLMLAAFIAGRTISAPEAPNLSPEVDLQMAALVDLKHDVTLDGVPLQAAVESLSKLYGCEIRLEQKVLEVAGIDTNAPIWFTGRRITLPEVFRKARLEPQGIHQERVPDRFQVQIIGGSVTVTTPEDVVRHAVTRVYDVERLILLRAALPSLGSLEETSFEHTSTMPSSTAPAGLFARTTEPAITDPIEASREWVELALQGHVAAETWQGNGGQVGQLWTLDGYLIVEQTPDVHLQIADFLNQQYERDLQRLKNRDELRQFLDEKAK